MSKRIFASILSFLILAGSFNVNAGWNSWFSSASNALGGLSECITEKIGMESRHQLPLCVSAFIAVSYSIFSYKEEVRNLSTDRKVKDICSKLLIYCLDQKVIKQFNYCPKDTLLEFLWEHLYIKSDYQAIKEILIKSYREIFSEETLKLIKEYNGNKFEIYISVVIAYSQIVKTYYENKGDDVVVDSCELIKNIIINRKHLPSKLQHLSIFI